MNLYLSKRASIGTNVLIGYNVSIYGECSIADNCFIGDNVTIGYPSFDEIAESKGNGNINNIDDISVKPTEIGENVILLSNDLIFQGVNIKDNTRISEFCRIGDGTSIGRNCKILYGALHLQELESEIINGGAEFPPA